MDPLFTQAQRELQERMAELPDEITSIITDGTLDAVVFGIQEKYSLTPKQVTSLENEIIFVLTFFFETTTFVDNVQESLKVERSIAEAIGVEVKTEIFELIEDIITYVESAKKEIAEEINPTPIPALVTKKEELKNLAQTFGQPSSERLQNPNLETLTENVEPLRTMERDMTRIHGYGAYEETRTEIKPQERETDTTDVVTQHITEFEEKLPS